MSTLSSGLLRNRFRLIINSGIMPGGFIYDDARIPGTEIDAGFGIVHGSVWDGDNRSAEISYDILSISGYLELSDYKSHLNRGLAVLQAGIGDNADCILSGITTPNANTWNPIISPGVFFDLEKQFYLHTSGSQEVIVSGADKRTHLDYEPLPPHPISLGTFFMDNWGKAYAYEQFRRKVKFTGISGIEDTLDKVPNTDPPLYDPNYSGIKWYNVDQTLFEFMLDPDIPEIIRSRDIVSGVHAILRKAPYAKNQYQLPLVPIAAISGYPTINVYADRVEISGGIGRLTVSGLGTFSGLLATSGAYVRLSGSLENTETFIPTQSSVTTWPSIGQIFIDDVVDPIFETVNYSGVSISGFVVSGVRNGVPHRDGSQIRYILSGAVLSGSFVSGLSSQSGYDVFVNYSVLMSGNPPYNPINGLMTVSGTENVARADIDLRYYRAILLCYEPSGIPEYNIRPNLNINPLIHGQNDGILWFSLYPSKAKHIRVTTGKDKDTDGIVGPVYAGNDFLSITALVTDRFGAPVPDELISVAFSNVNNIGQIDGFEPTEQEITKQTNSTGEAKFVYTPPETIHGLGYFCSSGSVINNSGLRFNNTFDLEEIYENGEWKTLTFSVWKDDVYDVFTQSSGEFEYTADGRFELISYIAVSGSLGDYVQFAPIQPIAALDETGAILSTSGQVKTLVYTSGQLPINESEIGAYFISADKRIKIGIVAPLAQVSSQTLEIKLGIPPFMTGEMMFGTLENVETKSLDSLAYLTINPFTMGFIDESRFDPRQLGNVFKIQGTKSDEYIRNKFYFIPDWGTLYSTPGNNDVRRQFTFRNRFILEVN